jgi:hypothetical protein
MEEGRDRDTRHVFRTELPRARDTPVRLAFATLVGSRRFWIRYVIGLPVAALLAAFAHRGFVSIAAGMPVGISLLLLWLSHEFARPRLVLDTDDRTLTIAKPYATAIDAGDVHDLETQLERLGVPVQVYEPPSTALSLDAVRARVIATPVVLFGSVAVVRWAFGPDAFRTGVVAVPAVLLVGSVAYSFWWRHVRWSDRD